MQELLKVTPKSWPDHDVLLQAVQQIEATVKGANETKRVTDELVKVVEIQNRFILRGAVRVRDHIGRHDDDMLTRSGRRVRGV